MFLFVLGAIVFYDVVYARLLLFAINFFFIAAEERRLGELMLREKRTKAERDPLAGKPDVYKQFILKDREYVALKKQRELQQKTGRASSNWTRIYHTYGGYALMFLFGLYLFFFESAAVVFLFDQILVVNAWKWYAICIIARNKMYSYF